MGCSCKSGKKSTPQSWTVTLAGGRQVAYSSEIAARAKVAANPGAILTPPPGASV